MSNKRRLVPFAACASLLALPACGTTTGGVQASSSACTGVVHVATDLPVSGSDRSDGKPTENGARLAVAQANTNNLLEGCTVTLEAKDDASVALGKHDPNLGAQNIAALSGDPSIVGVVGPFNSSVAKAELTTANNAGLVLISPANTNPGLTIVGSNPDIDTNQLRPRKDKVSYFRVCTTDIGQGKGLADTATNKLKVTKAFIIDDAETYGVGLGQQFAKDFKANGDTVLETVSLPGTTKDFKDTLNKAKGEGADLIFFGGTSSNGGGIVRKQMADAGLGSVAFLGGDGIVDDEFFTEAGASGNGAYGTVAAPDPAKLSSATRFRADYKAAYGSDATPYATNAYDAMNIILHAVKKAIDDGGGKLPGDAAAFREAVRVNVSHTDYNGVIGHTTFDANGDTTNILLSLYKGAGGKWTSDSTVTLKA